MAKSYTAPPPMTIDPNKTLHRDDRHDRRARSSSSCTRRTRRNHVNSFVFLARDGFYDGVIFHRVIPGFMIQGGDPTGTGTGGPGYKLKQEFNRRSHKRGVLSMARTNDPNSAGSQFFVMHADSPLLDNQYTAFGKVDQRHRDASTRSSAPPATRNDRPKNPTKINKITIEEK